jgi:hypothetical protein
MSGRIAINVCDMTYFTDPKMPIQPAALLLQDFITKDSPTVNINTMLDSGAVILDGPASQDEKRVNALVELLQTVLGPKKIGRRVRCYQEGPRGGWSEISVRSKATV